MGKDVKGEGGGRIKGKKKGTGGVKKARECCKIMS